MSEPRLEVSEEVKGTPWWGMHVARYLFAMPYANEKRVLDVACGSGYGLEMLGRSAKEVIGVDVEFNIIKKAKDACFGDSRISFLVADGCKLPFANSCFDVVTSFETIEHIHDRSGFLQEIRRVLKDEGVLILSTPNAHYTQPVNGKPRNPYHVYEYTPEELFLELSRYFEHVKLLGQTLSSRFKISPFWDDQQRLPRTIGAQSNLLLWRVLNKLPETFREKASQIVWGHPFIPSENDYEFSESTVKTAPVTVAICREFL